MRTCSIFAIFMLSLLPLTSTVSANSAKWTVMLYMDGDNDLERYISKDINRELGLIGSSTDVNVIAIADRKPGSFRKDGNWTSTKIFYITEGMTATPSAAIEDWGERNMGDPETLVDFMNWAKFYYPAEHYALVFWDHGWGWRPSQTMWDTTNRDALDQHEILAALLEAGPVDIVAYDACQMQSIEVQATFRQFTGFLVASQESVGGRGFNYETILMSLRSRPEMSIQELAIEFSNSMTDWTSSVVTLNSNWDQLIEAVDQWSLVMLDGLPAYRIAYDNAWALTQGFDDPLYKDLADAAYQIQIQVDDSVIQFACQAVIDAVKLVVVDEWHRRKYPGANGISIFWPRLTQDLDEPSSTEWNDFEYYQQKLQFAEMTHWDEFLAAYVNR
ncbi:MAG: clostripain-related cysteine peptidase [Desulfatirhabdiaceae bacterium]